MQLPHAAKAISGNKDKPAIRPGERQHTLVRDDAVDHIDRMTQEHGRANGRVLNHRPPKRRISLDTNFHGPRLGNNTGTGLAGYRPLDKVAVMAWRVFISAVLALALSACASQIMRGYVGKPLQEVMLDYGPPVNAMDMPDGTRAFQWAISSAFVTPTHVTSTTTPAGNMWLTNTQITGGQLITNSCVYTMFARWSEEQRTWVFTDFRRPSALCE